MLNNYSFISLLSLSQGVEAHKECIIQTKIPNVICKFYVEQQERNTIGFLLFELLYLKSVLY